MQESKSLMKVMNGLLDMIDSSIITTKIIVDKSSKGRIESIFTGLSHHFTSS